MPEEVECLEVRYSAARPGLRPTTRGRTFSKVLGTQTSFLEILLLDRRIKGPCWLDVVNPTLAKLKYSHCGLEVDCWSLGDLRVGSEALGEAPPLTAVTLNITTSVDPETRTNETVMVSCLQHTKYSVQQPPDDIYEEQFCGRCQLVFISYKCCFSCCVVCRIRL